MVEEQTNVIPLDVKYHRFGNRRKYKRVPVDFPVVLEFSGETISGQALNGCNEGLIVESYMSSEYAQGIMGMLSDRPLKVALQFTHNKRTYKTEGELKHFYLDFLGNHMCRIKIGLFIPKMETVSEILEP